MVTVITIYQSGMETVIPVTEIHAHWVCQHFMNHLGQLLHLAHCKKLSSLDHDLYSQTFLQSIERTMNGQIFIGMITLNFQPKMDILALIEQLDHACIRFVHFSEDQVLRSKVWILIFMNANFVLSINLWVYFLWSVKVWSSLCSWEAGEIIVTSPWMSWIPPWSLLVILSLLVAIFTKKYLYVTW